MVARNIAFSVFVLLACSLPLPAPGGSQYSTVRRVTAETADGVVFTVTVAQPVLTPGKDITLHYVVKNDGSKAIHFVRETPPNFEAEEGGILVTAPVPLPVGHGGYDYSFTKIETGEEYKGQIVIPSRLYPRHDVWPIEVAFGYVTDVSGLDRRLRQGEDPAALRGLLNSRLKTVVLGKLGVDVREKH